MVFGASLGVASTNMPSGSPPSISGNTLAEVIDSLEADHAGLNARLVKEGVLHLFVNVYVNDEDVRFTGALDTSLDDNASVTILPAVAGGC